MIRSRHSRPRYKSRLINDRESTLPSMLFPCSPSLSESESISSSSRSSLTLFSVLFLCSLVSLSFTCSNVSLHLRVLRPLMQTDGAARQDTRPRAHKTRGKDLEKGSCETTCFVLSQHQPWVLTRLSSTNLTASDQSYSPNKIISLVNIINQQYQYFGQYNLLVV